MSLLPLRALLLVDAFGCAGLGLGLLAAPATVGGWTALPPTLPTGAGVTLPPVVTLFPGRAGQVVAS